MSRLLRIPLGVLVVLSCALNASAHGGGAHEQIVLDDNADWATKHMAEEHHISTFDALSFFRLHDYDSTGVWTTEDIRRTYGLRDPSSAHISELKKQGVVDTVLGIYDANKDGEITSEEFVSKWDAGEKLPDFGMGPGHHGDDEYEYEIHHWEKYHSGDDVKEEDLNHPEDIEHFAKHDEMDRRREEWEKMEWKGVVERNIPAKFRIN
ncbi:secretory pathway protein-like protein Ssp120 [Aaosphaeria arxii CBS 175.79]|uniref:Secretory pathway protein-like protein Ssp120 n=1 Tax=Aaosphaeria arxii CBS 175.79 TaxID=1450172 RepID=A0A6A5XAM8_9PLEO|nr:secretory pathway protein-like protein Ssp120 [Aaosphaeria arxii CBS 175.79]KAF2009963.1 secretory pathway protein-like protein Ssp120 [Aaosphaeria arxii CBS 175.79]